MRIGPVRRAHVLGHDGQMVVDEMRIAGDGYPIFALLHAEINNVAAQKRIVLIFTVAVVCDRRFIRRCSGGLEPSLLKQFAPAGDLALDVLR
jgi:hypothetical protein